MTTGRGCFKNIYVKKNARSFLKPIDFKIVIRSLRK